MPPDLDIYVFSRRRDAKTIERFVREYVDRDASEDRGNEDLMMLALDPDMRAKDTWDWEPARTLTQAITRGLDCPRRAFCVYLTTVSASLTQAIIAFTSDDAVVFGLAIDDEGQLAENEQRARTLLDTLAKEFDGELGVIGCELPPPLSAMEMCRSDRCTRGAAMLPRHEGRWRDDREGEKLDSIRWCGPTEGRSIDWSVVAGVAVGRRLESSPANVAVGRGWGEAASSPSRSGSPSMPQRLFRTIMRPSTPTVAKRPVRDYA